MSKRHEARTWHPPAGLPAQVQDPAVRAILRAFRRALARGLDTDRAPDNHHAGSSRAPTG